MHKQPLASIITPSFNQAQFLDQTIASVIGQDYSNVEYMVFDGGSTDDSVSIISKHQDRLAYWISESDNGQSDAINRGWQRSQGEILAWLNSDDIYEPGAVSAVVDVFQRHPEIDVVTGDCQVIDETGRFLYNLPSGDFDIRLILSGNSLPQQGVFCRRSAVEAVGWLDPELNYIFDWALWLKLWLNGATFYHLGHTVASFRVWGHAKTATGTIGASLSGGVPFARERLGVLSELKTSSLVEKRPELRPMLEEAWRGVLLELGLLHQLNDEPATADDYFREFAQAGTAVSSPFPYSQALAAHLAYVEGDLPQINRQFVQRLSNTLGDHTFDPGSVERQLLAETRLVQAWHASHLKDHRTASKFFCQAIIGYPALAMQRRAISPAIKHIVKSVGVGSS